MTTSKTKKRGTKKSRAKKAKPAKRSPRAAFAVATNEKKSSAERAKAFAEAPLATIRSDDTLQASLNVLRDRQQPIKVRLAALQSLQAATFAVLEFEPHREEYLATLRELVDDPDDELRQRVLGILAREKDGYVQQRLLEGLKDPSKALVPPEKALQLLSYDVHAEAYPVAREILNAPPNPDAKREALRLLSADAKSAPVFEKMMRDKDEDRDIRQISAAALQSVQPKRFQEQAREMLLDKNEYDDIQATALTALEQFGDEKAVAKDQQLLDRVDELGGAKSGKVKKSAKRFMTRYGGEK
jgi:HEAT repeat protein